MFKCWHPKDRARDGIAAVMVHLSFCLLSGILQIRCEMMFTFAGCGMQYSICSDRLKKEKKYGDIIYRENDRIMQIKNNYDIYWEKNNDEVEYGSGVFNGEFGTIIKINESEKQIKIKFDDEKVAWYQYTDLDQIEHAYAITVHKAQRK